MKNNLTTLLRVVIAMLGLAIASPAFALTLSPAKIEVTGDPGSVLVGEIKLYNEQDREEKLYISYENFEPSDDSGTPRFVGATEGLATWIKTEQDVINMDAKNRREVPFRITIPSDAEPGGYFAAVFFGNQPPSEDGGQVSIGGRLGVLVLLRVSGDVPETGGITEFYPTKKQLVYSHLPISFTHRFSNTGGDRTTPKGEIQIKNMFGFSVDTVIANEIGGTVLPQSTRKFEAIWTAKKQPKGFFGTVWHQVTNFHIGFYTANISLGWGTQNQTAASSTMFFMFPWQILVVVSLLFVFLVGGGRLMLNQYKKSLIAQLQKTQNNPEQK